MSPKFGPDEIIGFTIGPHCDKIRYLPSQVSVADLLVYDRCHADVFIFQPDEAIDVFSDDSMFWKPQFTTPNHARKFF